MAYWKIIITRCNVVRVFFRISHTSVVPTMYSSRQFHAVHSLLSFPFQYFATCFFFWIHSAFNFALIFCILVVSFSFLLLHKPYHYNFVLVPFRRSPYALKVLVWGAKFFDPPRLPVFWCISNYSTTADARPYSCVHNNGPLHFVLEHHLSTSDRTADARA